MSSTTDFARRLVKAAEDATPIWQRCTVCVKAATVAVLRTLDEAGYYCDPSDGPHLRQIADEIEGNTDD